MAKKKPAGRKITAKSIELKVVNRKGKFSYDLEVVDDSDVTFGLRSRKRADSAKEIQDVFRELGTKWPDFGLSFVVDDLDDIVGLA